MRHVPTLERLRPEDIGFEAALAASQQPNAAYDVDKWLFVPNTYQEYRYLLGTRGQDPLLCIGVNPSTAAPDRLDPTLKSVQRIALNNGFDSFIMLNLSAQRATDPDLMAQEPDEELHAQNLEAFRYALGLCRRPSVWAAWGNVIAKRSYLYRFAGDFIKTGLSLEAGFFCCGSISKLGHPHHPLYLKSDEPLRPFDARGYLLSLSAHCG